MTTKTNPPSNYEPGYAPLLVREETKARLQALRKNLANQDLMQERRLATAAIELIVEESVKDDDILEQLLRRAAEIVIRDIKSEEEDRARKKKNSELLTEAAA